LVLCADSSLEFLIAPARRGLDGFSSALFEAFLLMLAESKYFGVRHCFLLNISGHWQIELLPSEKSLIFCESICEFGEFGIGFGEFAISTIKICIFMIAVFGGFFVFVDWDLVLVRAVEDAEYGERY
jgi:hypothetical protein